MFEMLDIGLATTEQLNTSDIRHRSCKMNTSLRATAMIAFAATLSLGSASLHAESETVETREMSFEECLKTIRNASSQLGVAPVNIVETDVLRMVRFWVDDGSIIVTCSALDRKMVITKSDQSR